MVLAFNWNDLFRIINFNKTEESAPKIAILVPKENFREIPVPIIQSMKM